MKSIMYGIYKKSLNILNGTENKSLQRDNRKVVFQDDYDFSKTIVFFKAVNHYRFISLFLIFVFFSSIVSLQKLSAQTLSYKLINQFDLKNELVNEHKNVLKLYDVAVDEVRGLAYTSGFQTEYASIIDLTTKQEIGSVELPFKGLKNELECNPSNGFLLATTLEPEPDISYLINPSNSQVVGSYIYQSNCNGICFDASNNFIYLADNNIIKQLDGANFNMTDSLFPGFVVGDIEMDTLNNKIYVLSQNLIGGVMKIKVFASTPPFSLHNTIDIISSNILGELILDIPNNRLFISGINETKTIDILTESILSSVSTSVETSDKVYSSFLQTIFMINDIGYSGQGEHGSWSKIYKHVPGTTSLDSMKMGDKTLKLAIDNTGDLLIVPNMHSDYVELKDLHSTTIDTIDVGESADDLAMSPNGENLYIIKRLGGSRVISYDNNIFQLSQMKAGNWPCAIAVDSVLAKFFVLNIFESSITVFNSNTNEAIDTIMLSIPEARSDAVPYMYLDTAIHMLFISFPEFGNIIKVNCQTLSEDSVILIPGFHYDEDNHVSVGNIQLVTVPIHNKLLVLQYLEKKLKVFDLNTFALLDSIDMSSSWPTGSVFQRNLLYYNSTSDNLFFGNKIISTINYNTIAALPSSERILGYYNDNKIYGISSIGGEVTIHEYNAGTLEITSSHILFQQLGIAMPVFYYDSKNNDLFIAEFNYAILRHFDLDSTTIISSLDNEHELVGYSLQTVPNPFNNRATINFEIPNSAKVHIAIYDINGKFIETIVNENLVAGSYKRDFFPKTNKNGIYFIVFQTPEKRIIKKMVFVR